MLTILFGPYDSVNNSGGMRFDKIPALVGSIWLGTIVTSFIFSSFGILVSMIGNKIQILITLVATSIVLMVYSLIGSFVLTPLSKQMQGQIGNKLSSFKVINQSGKASAYANTFNQPNDDLYDLYLQYPQIGNQIYQYFNFQQQQAGLYNAFDVNDLELNLGSMPFGESASYQTNIKSKDANLLNYLQALYDAKDPDNFNLAMPFTNVVLENNNDMLVNDSLKLIVIGPKTDVLFAMKYAGSKPNSIYISNSSKMLGYFPSHWLSMEDMIVSKDEATEKAFEKDVFENITKKLFEDEAEYKDATGTSKKYYRDITGDWEMISEQTQDWKNQQQIFQEYFKLCYNLLKDNEYGIPYESEQDMNDSIGKIQSVILKQLCGIYWNQVVNQIITYYKNAKIQSPKGEEYSFKQYINCDDVGVLKNIPSSRLDTSKCTSFQYAFTIPGIKVYNPFNANEVINVGDDFTLLKLSRMFMGYTSACLFATSSGGTVIKQIIGAYSTIGNDTFAGAYAHAKKLTSSYEYTPTDTDDWGFDYSSNSTYGKGSSVIFNAMVANAIDIKQCANSFGLANMYNYSTTPYIDNTTAIIIWTIVGMIMVVTAAIIYQRSDIK
ncbi:MAG: hypothetical protein HUJ52_00895 [Malacoplasma sp.]|nr:hypothetical protein [Malacoplasma sp.]